MKKTTVTLLDDKEYTLAYTLAARMNIKNEMGKNAEDLVNENGELNEEDMFKIIYIILSSQAEPFPYTFEQFLTITDLSILQGFMKMNGTDQGNLEAQTNSEPKAKA